MASNIHTFSITQARIGEPLQFNPAHGSKELDELVDAYVLGSAPKQDKLSEVTLEFFNLAQVDIYTGLLTRHYHVAIPISPTWTFDQSPSQSQSSDFSPIYTPSPASSMTFADSGYGSISMTPPARMAPHKVVKKTTKATKAAKKPEARLPGFSIMTRDGVDVTTSAGRGTKTKEQREHAHLMRIMKACDECKRKKIRCDPAHRRSHNDMTRSSTSTSSSSRPNPSPPTSTPSLSRGSTQSSPPDIPSFGPNSSAIDDFVLFPEETAASWNPADVSLDEFNDNFDLSQFNFDISGLNDYGNPSAATLDFTNPPYANSTFADQSFDYFDQPTMSHPRCRSVAGGSLRVPCNKLDGDEKFDPNQANFDTGTHDDFTNYSSANLHNQPYANLAYANSSFDFLGQSATNSPLACPTRPGSSSDQLHSSFAPDQYGLEQRASAQNGPVHTRPHHASASQDLGQLETNSLQEINAVHTRPHHASVSQSGQLDTSSPLQVTTDLVVDRSIMSASLSRYRNNPLLGDHSGREVEASISDEFDVGSLLGDRRDRSVSGSGALERHPPGPFERVQPPGPFERAQPDRTEAFGNFVRNVEARFDITQSDRSMPSQTFEGSFGRPHDGHSLPSEVLEGNAQAPFDATQSLRSEVSRVLRRPFAERQDVGEHMQTPQGASDARETMKQTTLTNIRAPMDTTLEQWALVKTVVLIATVIAFVAVASALVTSLSMVSDLKCLVTLGLLFAPMLKHSRVSCGNALSSSKGFSSPFEETFLLSTFKHLSLGQGLITV